MELVIKDKTLGLSEPENLSINQGEHFPRVEGRELKMLLVRIPLPSSPRWVQGLQPQLLLLRDDLQTEKYFNIFSEIISDEDFRTDHLNIHLLNVKVWWAFWFLYWWTCSSWVKGKIDPGLKQSKTIVNHSSIRHKTQWLKVLSLGAYWLFH